MITLWTALLYWCLINMSTLPILAILTYGKPGRYGYDYKIKINLIQYFTPYQIGKFGAIAWTILFAPFLEEVVFFAIPSIFGYDYMIIGLIAWSSVHIARMIYMYNFVERWRFIGIITVYTLYIVLNGVLSLWLWGNGYGILSIALHSLHNALCVLSLGFIYYIASKIKRNYMKRSKYWIRC